MDNAWQITSLSPLHSSNSFRFPLRFPWGFSYLFFFFSHLAFSVEKDPQNQGQRASMIPHSIATCQRKFPVLQCLQEAVPQMWGTTGQAHLGRALQSRDTFPCLPAQAPLHSDPAPLSFLLSLSEQLERFQTSPWRVALSRVSHCNAVSCFSAASMLALSHFFHFSMLPLSLLSSQLSSAEPHWPATTTSTVFNLPQFWAAHPCEHGNQPRAEYIYCK